MQSGQFRKLNIDLPRQPLINQRPWLIAGVGLVIVLLAIIAWCYLATSADNRQSERSNIMIDY